MNAGVSRIAVSIGTSIVWLAVVADAFSLLPPWYTAGMDRLMIALAVCGSGRLMLWCYQRPLGAVYQVGYEDGRRDQMRDSNPPRNVSPIRRVPGGFSEFNRTHGKQLRAPIDA